MSEAAQRVSGRQLRTLQTLFGLYARHSLGAAGNDLRAERLAWASQHLGRPVSSFRELLAGEAARLIDSLKRALGQKVHDPWRRPRNRETARAAGRQGRRKSPAEVAVIASPDDLARVDALRRQVGMTPEDLEVWLRSRTSPIGQSGRPIRSLADANRVCWALKAMLRRAG